MSRSSQGQRRGTKGFKVKVNVISKLKSRNKALGCGIDHLNEALQQTQTDGWTDHRTDGRTDRQRDTIKFIVSLLCNASLSVKTATVRSCTVKVNTPHLLILPICIPYTLSIGT